MTYSWSTLAFLWRSTCNSDRASTPDLSGHNVSVTEVWGGYNKLHCWKHEGEQSRQLRKSPFCNPSQRVPQETIIRVTKFHMTNNNMMLHLSELSFEFFTIWVRSPIRWKAAISTKKNTKFQSYFSYLTCLMMLKLTSCRHLSIHLLDTFTCQIVSSSSTCDQPLLAFLIEITVIMPYSMAQQPLKSFHRPLMRFFIVFNFSYNYFLLEAEWWVISTSPHEPTR